MNVLAFHKNIKIRLVESFLSTTISGMIFPFMAIYLTSHFGEKLTGVLLMMNVFVGIFINFVGGYFSDQYGRKKIIVFAESLRFLGFLTMMICNSPWFHSALITYFMMTINSICWGLGGPANQAMLIDVSKPEQRKTMYTIMYWSNNLSIAIGGIFGGFLFKTHLFELLISLSIASLVTWILITFFVQESYVPSHSNKKKATNHAKTMVTMYKEVFNDKLFILFVLASVFVLSMEFQLTNYISIRLSSDMGIKELFTFKFSGIEIVGFLRTENTILVVVLTFFVSKILKGMKDSMTLIWTCLLFVIGYSFISYSTNVWILFVMMFIATAAEVLRTPVQQNYMSALPPEKLRSSYMAIGGLTFNIAMLITSITVFLSAYMNRFFTSCFITSIGILGVIVFIKIASSLDKRLREKQHAA